MKKNIRLNKQIIKALSVGISASMLLQPVSAMAAELDTTTPEPVTDGAEDTSEKTAYDNAEDNAVVADEAVETAIDASEEAIEAVGEEAAQNVQDAAVSFNNAVEDNKDILADDIADDVAASGDAEEIIEDMEAMKSLIEAATVSGNNAAVSGNEAAEAADNAVTDATTVADNANTVVDNAITSVSENEQKLLDATSEEEANAIYAQIVNDVSGADAAVTKAEEDFALLETAFNNAKNTYNEKSAAYTAAQAALTQALSDYQDLVDAGEDVTDDALTILETLRTNAAALKAEAETAYQNFISSGYGYIAYHEDRVKNEKDYIPQGGNKWTDVRDYLFEAIIQYYYVSDMKNGEFVSATWTKNADDDSLNYCTVVYKDAEGNEVTELLNYRLANKNGSGGFVIFEKTEHLVFGETDFTAEEKEALDNGDVVIKNGIAVVKNEDGEYVAYNDASKTEEVLVEEYANNEESVDIVENTVEVSYTVEDGKLVKTETADVITTTYTGETLDASAVDQESEDDARAAYVAAVQAIIDNLAEGESIVIADVEYSYGDTATDAGFVATSQEVVTDYSVSGTYNEKFTKTVNISDSVWAPFTGREGAKDAYESDVEAVRNQYVLDYEGLSTQKQYTLLSETHTDPTIKNEGLGVYSYSGSVTVSYSKVATKSLDDFSWIASLFFGQEEQEDALRDALAKEGKIFVGLDGFDWRLFKGTVYYVDAVQKSETNIQAASEDEAKAMFLASAPENAYNTTVSSVTANTQTRYGYDTISYILQVATVENTTISTAEWAEILGNATFEYRNDNLNNGNIILAERDRTNKVDYYGDDLSEHYLDEDEAALTADFRKKVDSAAQTAQMYQNLLQKTADAEAAIVAAKEKVDALQKEILALAASGELSTLNALQADLDAAIRNLQAAIDKRDDLKEKLDEITDELEDKIDDLTEEVGPGPGPGPNPGPDVTPTNITDITDVITPVTPAPFVPAAVPGPAVVAEIPDDEVPQADAPDAEIDDVAPVATAEIEDDDVALAAAPVNIGDDATPLASIPEEAQMSWWWLLIVLVLGATGAEMYRRHMAKKKAQGITDDTVK
ncbi:MAG: hypothetical protein J6Z09_05700 [Lachnospiraceae bacterium]|nr:hypothetical protein [Lachnospiraceae bacterium]